MSVSPRALSYRCSRAVEPARHSGHGGDGGRACGGWWWCRFGGSGRSELPALALASFRSGAWNAGLCMNCRELH